MKTFLARILSAAVACLPAVGICVEAPRKEAPPAKAEKAVPRDGSSHEKAIVVKSVAAEYDWLKKKYPGYRLRQQALQNKDGKPYDVLMITTKQGKELDVYFDISSFFGK